jgi:hypothetical protein
MMKNFFKPLKLQGKVTFSCSGSSFLLHSWHFERLRESKHYIKILNSVNIYKCAIRIFFTLKIGISQNMS